MDNSHYGNGVLAMFISSWKVNIAENPIAVMGLQIHSDMVKIGQNFGTYYELQSKQSEKHFSEQKFIQ